MRPRRALIGALVPAAVATVLATALVTGAQAAPAPEPGAPAPTPASTFPEVPFTLTNAATEQCLTAVPGAAGAPTAGITMADCDGGSDQRWTYDPPSKRMRVAKLGTGYCLSAKGPSMERCPDLRSDTYRWIADDGIYTPGSTRRYLGVETGADGTSTVVLAPPKDAGEGFDWVVTPVEKKKDPAAGA